MALFRFKKPDDLSAPSSAPNPAVQPVFPAAPEAAGQTVAAGKDAAPTVTVLDSFGRAIQLPREQWRKEVLPKMVEGTARDPQRLAALVLQCLRDGLAVEVLPAALRLAAVDPDIERSLAVLAAVQREIGDLDDSARTLQELQQKRPQSLAALVGLALLREKAGQRSAGLALLWDALQIDANYPDALHGWLQWESERVGDAGFSASLDTACNLPKSWRARLWRARRAFEQQRIDEGIAELRAVFEIAGDDSDALTMAAGDLLRAKRQDLIAEMVLPRYRIERHHPNIGVLLLEHFAATKQPVLGEQMLHELRVRFPRMLDAQVARFDQVFTRMAAPAEETDSGASSRITLYRLDRPLWFAAIGEPEWMLPKKASGARRVLFAALSVPLSAGPQDQARAEEAGRLSRSVPLFLAEKLWLLSPLCGSVVMPVAGSGGFVVSAVPWAEERLVDLMSAADRQQILLVSGTVSIKDQKRRIDMWVYDCNKRQRIGHVMAESGAEKNALVLQPLLAELATILGIPPIQQPPFGNDLWWERYSIGLAQVAALVIAQIGSMPKDRIHGQRAILEWLLAMSLEEPRWAPAKLALAAGICADAAIGSHVYSELAAPFAELFRIEPHQSPFAKAAVKPLKVLGLLPVWQQRRAEILAGGGADYLAWVQRIENS